MVRDTMTGDGCTEVISHGGGSGGIGDGGTAFIEGMGGITADLPVKDDIQPGSWIGDGGTTF